MKITDELLEKYAAGNCTDVEKDAVEQWLASSSDFVGDDHAYLFEAHHAAGKKRFTEYLQTTQKKSYPFRRVIHYAAAAVILFTIGISSYILFKDRLLNAEKNTFAYENYQVEETVRGDRKVITLPDGSTVHLNYETQLRIPEQFNSTERIVFLEGHAHFDVARDEQRPFIIYTENSKTQVLGTSFDINTHSMANETEVIVTSGKVAFSEKANEAKKVILTLDDRAVLYPNQEIGVSQVDAELLTSWKAGQLVFNYTSLEDIIKVLEPWYDITITVTDEALLPNTYKFSHKNPSLETLMEQMSFVGDFNYSIEGNQVTIY